MSSSRAKGLNLEVRAVTTVFYKDNDSFSHHTVGNTNTPVCFRMSVFSATRVLVTVGDPGCDAVQSGI